MMNYIMRCNFEAEVEGNVPGPPSKLLIFSFRSL